MESHEAILALFVRFSVPFDFATRIQKQVGGAQLESSGREKRSEAQKNPRQYEASTHMTRKSGEGRKE